MDITHRSVVTNASNLKPTIDTSILREGGDVFSFKEFYEALEKQTCACQNSAKRTRFAQSIKTRVVDHVCSFGLFSMAPTIFSIPEGLV